MDIKKLEDKIPKILNTEIHYDNIKLSDKLYNKWINNMNNLDERLMKGKRRMKNGNKHVSNKPSNKRLFLKKH